MHDDVHHRGAVFSDVHWTDGHENEETMTYSARHVRLWALRVSQFFAAKFGVAGPRVIKLALVHAVTYYCDTTAASTPALRTVFSNIRTGPCTGTPNGPHTEVVVLFRACRNEPA